MFGISNNVKSQTVRECTADLFGKTIDSPLVARVCEKLKDALEKRRRGEMSKEDYDAYKTEQKKQLPVFTPHATFRNGRRRNDDAVPSGLSMYDVDHISDPRGYYDKKIKGIETLLGVVLAHVTPSGEGLRLFFIMPKGMDLAQAQKWMSRQLGDNGYDECVKDYARCSFAVPRSYIIYMDNERLFDDVEPLEVDDVESVFNEENKAQESEEKGEMQETEQNVSDECFKGIPYSDIISAWFEITGGEPEKGERNTRLHRLASHLRYITDNDEALMLRVMPRYGLGETEIKSLIHSACAARFCSTPKEMKKAIAKASGDENIMEEELSTPPEMPKKLPPLIKLLVSKTPDIYKPAVAHAVFPALATHLHRVTFKYIDNEEHEATLMNVLMAGTGAGKNCINKPINRIMADIKARDAVNLRREREWKNEVNSKGSNKDKRQRPEGLVIQCIDPDMTNPAFVMRTAEADGHFLYTRMNEIDQFDSLKGNGKGNHHFQIMCLAFDPENEYGQTRVGTQSITEKVQIRFNWNASTTIKKGRAYFSRVLTDGPISRLNFCTIPEREIGADMPVYGEYDTRFDRQLKPYIDNLCKAGGRVICNEATALAKRLQEECAEFARLSESRVYENLSYRALVIAWLKACVLYVANGKKWDNTFDEFIRWSLQYDLWCKIAFFGSAIENAERESACTTQQHSGPRNMLELLPNEFTREDAVKVRILQGKSERGTNEMLRNWERRGYLKTEDRKNYTKLKYNNVYAS
ncbi:MAG: BT4734/BF3469 family protein [Prevotellaceae bacterium]|nr:BT4734/BF3469 family protein [Prevotellaceae bacterium]